MIKFTTEFTGETTIDDIIKLSEFTALQIKWNQRLIDEICEHETPIETRVDDVEKILDETARRVEELEEQFQDIDLADLITENQHLKSYNDFLEKKARA